MEIWKKIPDHDGYEASFFGEIKSIDRVIKHPTGAPKIQLGRILKKSLGDYYMVRPSINGKCKTKRVHVLVAMAFHGYKPGNRKVHIDHIDDDKLNNRADNLRVVSARENNNKSRNIKLSKLRSHKSRKSIDRLINESKARDEEQIKAGTHEWVYDQSTRINVLIKCTQKKK